MALLRIYGCESTRAADVVFVHGLGGDPLRTWRYGDDESTSWLHQFGPECKREIAVWSLGYPASPTRWSLSGLLRMLWRTPTKKGRAMALSDRATQAIDLMLQTGLGDRPLMFVCHSLGGLLVKEVLRTSAGEPRTARLYESTKAVMFLATPHAGSQLANFAAALRSLRVSTSVEDLRTETPYLETLASWYRDNSGHIQTRTYRETLKTRGVLVVPRTSANPGIGPQPVALDEDHFSIAAPRSPESQVFAGAKALLLTLFVPPAGPVPDRMSRESMRSCLAAHSHQETIFVHLNTHVRTADTRAAITLNWDGYFDGRLARPGVWNSHLLPMLNDLALTVRDVCPQNEIVFSGNCCLPVSIALGKAFAEPTGLNVAWQQGPGQRWSLHTQPEHTPFEATVQALNPTATDAAVLISVTTNVRASVRASELPQLGGRLIVEPVSRCYPARIERPSQATALAETVRHGLERLRESATQIRRLHVFYAGPVGLAMLIGQKLNTFGPVQTYEHIPRDMLGEYVPAALV